MPIFPSSRAARRCTNQRGSLTSDARRVTAFCAEAGDHRLGARRREVVRFDRDDRLERLDAGDADRVDDRLHGVPVVVVEVADQRERLAHGQRLAELIERLPAGVAADGLRRAGARLQRPRDYEASS